MDTETTHGEAGLGEVLRARATFYRALSSLYFLELTQEQIDGLAAQDFAALTGAGPLFDEGMDDIRRYLGRRNSATRQEMAADYARCMLGMGAQSQGAIPMPYESLFTSEQHLLMQDARDEVYRLFKRSRLRLKEGVDVPDDHLSFIFEYLACMSERAIALVEADDFEGALANVAAQKDLMEHHLCNWIDAYCDALLKGASTRFYQGLSKMTRAYVRSDAEVIDEIAACLAPAREDPARGDHA